MNKTTLRRELERLISEAPTLAPSVLRFDSDRDYGSFTDEQLDFQAFERWRIEVTAVLGELAASGSHVFVELNAKYQAVKFRSESQEFHSVSIFVHMAVQLLQSASQLLDSAVAEFEIGQPRSRTHIDKPALSNVGPEPPPKVTLQWLFKHVPVHLWLSAVGIAAAIFVAGMKSNDLPFVQAFLGSPTGPASTASAPKKP